MPRYGRYQRFPQVIGVKQPALYKRVLQLQHFTNDIIVKTREEKNIHCISKCKNSRSAKKMHINVENDTSTTHKLYYITRLGFRLEVRLYATVRVSK